ncbi:MAG: hypothetical protein ACTHMV_13570 [Chitinophagaceae bacterium]
MAKYKNLRKSDITHAAPGYAANAFIIPLSWIDTFGEPVGDVNVGNSVTIDESHVLLANKGAIAVYCVPKTIEGNGELVGESLAKKYAWRPKIIIPGDNPVVLETVKNLINENFLLLVKDAECQSEGYIQFGCDCDPCEVDTSTFTSGTAGEGRKGYELNLLTYCKFFYNGIIQELDDEAEEAV